MLKQAVTPRCDPSDSPDVQELCLFFEKMIEDELSFTEPSCAVRWTCIKAIKALNSSPIDARRSPPLPLQPHVSHMSLHRQ